MARTISDEELQLKRRARRRLIGALVLVAAIVVVLPMVLDSEPRPASQQISVQIPSPDSGAFASKLVPLPPGPESKTAQKTAPGKPTAEEPRKIAAASAPPSPAVEAPKVAPKPAAKRPEKISKPAPKAQEGQWVVQVIALADAEKAKQMQQQIASAGIKSYTEVVKTAKGDVTRVRAGPFASRSAAEKAREQLKALGMNGNITTR
jgi:DedD protein